MERRFLGACGKPRSVSVRRRRSYACAGLDQNARTPVGRNFGVRTVFSSELSVIKLNAVDGFGSIISNNSSTLENSESTTICRDGGSRLDHCWNVVRHAFHAVKEWESLTHPHCVPELIPLFKLSFDESLRETTGFWSQLAPNCFPFTCCESRAWADPDRRGSFDKLVMTVPKAARNSDSLVEAM